eukprot:7238910-Prymnesium_polylepis.1
MEQFVRVFSPRDSCSAPSSGAKACEGKFAGEQQEQLGNSNASRASARTPGRELCTEQVVDSDGQISPCYAGPCYASLRCPEAELALDEFTAVVVLRIRMFCLIGRGGKCSARGGSSIGSRLRCRCRVPRPRWCAVPAGVYFGKQRETNVHGRNLRADSMHYGTFGVSNKAYLV